MQLEKLNEQIKKIADEKVSRLIALMLCCFALIVIFLPLVLCECLGEILLRNT